MFSENITSLSIIGILQDIQSSKMSNRTTFMAIIFSFIIMRVKGEDEYEYYLDEGGNNLDEGFVCEKVITATDESGKHTAGPRVKMLKKCNSSYTKNDAIKQKCEEWPTIENQLRNQFLILPVPSNKMNIIYWNMYCAWCNFDLDLRFDATTPLLHFATINQCGLSKFYNFQYVTESVFSKYANALCYGNTPRFISEQILIDDVYCNETLSSSDHHDPVYQTSGNYCSIDLSMACPELPFRNDLVCTYGSDQSKYCISSFFLFEGINFEYGEDGAVYNSILGTFKYSRDEYSSPMGTDGVIYLCGEETPAKALNLTITLSYLVSTIFFILCVILNTNTSSLKNLHNRTLYSFCITQLIYLIFYFNDNFIIIHGLCIATYFVAQFVTLSRILWNMVVMFEYSRLVYCLIQNQRIPAEIQMKKYVVYCLVCWVLPAIATALPLLYISIINEKSSSCPTIKGYSLVHCIYDYKQHQYSRLLKIITVKMIFICSVIITLGSLAFALAIVYIERQNTIRSNCKRNYLLIYVKMMVAISAHLTLRVIYDLLPINIGVLVEIIRIIDGSLGVFVFFAFYYKKTMLNDMLIMCKLKKPLAPGNVEMNEQERPTSVER